MLKINNTLRPGLVVTLRTSVKGNAMYSREDVESPHEIDGGAVKSRWDTTKIVNDPKEYTEAMRIRSKATNRIRNVCVQSLNGLLCPTADQDKLDEAIMDAKDFIRDFNSKSKITTIGMYLIISRVAATDTEAVRAVNEEIQTLLDTMERGLKSFDVKTIREAAEQARQVGRMLPQESSKQVRAAIDAAREAAKKIKKAGENATIELDQQALTIIQTSRTMFLDMEDQQEDVEMPKVQGRAVDLEQAMEA